MKREINKKKREQVSKRGIKNKSCGLEAQKLQQLTSHGFFMSPEERLALSAPLSEKGTEGRGRRKGKGGGDTRMGEEKES